MWKGKIGTKSHENKDITKINKKFMANNPKEITKIAYGKEFKVDLQTGLFTIKEGSDEECPAHGATLPPNPELRWINFQRVQKIVAWNPPHKSIKTIFIYFIGWQTTIDTKNVKRMLKITPDGNYEIVTDS